MSDPREPVTAVSHEREQEIESLWGEYCMMCNNDWGWSGSCDHCKDSYGKLKAQGNLPRRRDAILATKSKHERYRRNHRL